ncbi:MAG: transporter, partial [Candidatus Babeliales bacterium]|nr:transporter [Candidatus Babeliales bacterium]
MKPIKIIIISGFLLSIINQTNCYNLPYVNLGDTNILDGGPIRPKPGWYFFPYTEFYHADRWTGPNGKDLFCTDTPTYNGLVLSFQYAYQRAQYSLLKGHLGLSIEASLLLYSQVDNNNIGIKNGSTGFGDTDVGVYLQWDTIMRGDRPIFAHRVQFTVGFPTGDYNASLGVINPGFNIFYIDPYWAATLYFNPKLTASWRLHYLWCAKNHATNIKAGDA